jgi:O-antigen/teichoic acid export membrane protein
VAVDLITPTSYHGEDLSGVVALVSISVLPWGVYAAGSQALVWIKRTRPLAWITPVAAVANLALVAILLPLTGLPGAAAATFLAYGLLGFLVTRAAGASAPVSALRQASFWTCAAVAIAACAFGGAAPALPTPWLIARIVLSVGLGVWFVLLGRRLMTERSPGAVTTVAPVLLDNPSS